MEGKAYKKCLLKLGTKEATFNEDTCNVTEIVLSCNLETSSVTRSQLLRIVFGESLGIYGSNGMDDVETKFGDIST